MKSESVKTLSIFMKGKKKAKWIFDVSDKTAEKILADFVSPSPVLQIDNVPTSTSVMTLYINKAQIEYVSAE